MLASPIAAEGLLLKVSGFDEVCWVGFDEVCCTGRATGLSAGDDAQQPIAEDQNVSLPFTAFMHVGVFAC